MDESAVRAQAEAVEGWLSTREGVLLYRLARACSIPGAIVEIGSWKGRSTIWLARGSEAGPGRKIVAIDPHTGSPEITRQLGEVRTFDEFMANLRRTGVEPLVEPRVQTSEQAARELAQPVALIFIDGAHEYEAVRRDFEAWFPRVVEGGIMAFHDTAWWNGPGRLVEEEVYRGRRFSGVGFAGSITYARKVERNSLSDRMRNRAMMLIKRVKDAVVRLRTRERAAG